MLKAYQFSKSEPLQDAYLNLLDIDYMALSVQNNSVEVWLINILFLYVSGDFNSKKKTCFSFVLYIENYHRVVLMGPLIPHMDKGSCQ